MALSDYLRKDRKTEDRVGLQSRQQSEGAQWLAEMEGGVGTGILEATNMMGL